MQGMLKTAIVTGASKGIGFAIALLIFFLNRARLHSS